MRKMYPDILLMAFSYYASDASNQAPIDDNSPSDGGAVGYGGNCFGEGATEGYSDNDELS